MAALDWVSREDGASGVTALGPEKTWAGSGVVPHNTRCSARIALGDGR
ncbi:predicted protein [Streptomyces albidoflavus]|nr:hypothetical protein SFR_1953 [Streptomyces sp. FR-008]EFE84016.1 predicted protein [Streptomyces albidoflavus]